MTANLELVRLLRVGHLSELCIGATADACERVLGKTDRIKSGHLHSGTPFELRGNQDVDVTLVNGRLTSCCFDIDERLSNSVLGVLPSAFESPTDTQQYLEYNGVVRTIWDRLTYDDYHVILTEGFVSLCFVNGHISVVRVSTDGEWAWKRIVGSR